MSAPDWKRLARPASYPRAIAPCSCRPDPFRCRADCTCVGCGCATAVKRPATYRADARQGTQPPAQKAKREGGATGVAGPVSPQLLRLASAIRWADERPACVDVLCDGLVTVSEANQRGHWAKGAGRAHRQRAAAFGALRGESRLLPGGSVAVLLTRYGPRRLDDDNLARGLKAVRDGVADWLQLDDGSERLTWLYQQARGEAGVRIQMWTDMGVAL